MRLPVPRELREVEPGPIQALLHQQLQVEIVPLPVAQARHRVQAVVLVHAQPGRVDLLRGIQAVVMAHTCGIGSGTGWPYSHSQGRPFHMKCIPSVDGRRTLHALVCRA